MSDAHDRLAGLDPDRLQQLAAPAGAAQPRWTEPPERIAQSIRTAQSIAHHALAALGDTSHDGEPRLCTRPLCSRLLSDAEDVEALAGAVVQAAQP